MRISKPGWSSPYPVGFRDRYGAQIAFNQQVKSQNPSFKTPEIYYYFDEKLRFAILETIPNPSDPIFPGKLRPFVQEAKKSIERAEDLAKVSMLDVRLDFIRCSTRIPVKAFEPYLQKNWPVDNNKESTQLIIDQLDKRLQQYRKTYNKTVDELFDHFGINFNFVKDNLAEGIQRLQQRPQIFVNLDLKTHNLLYPNRDANRRPYVVDFDDLLIGDPLLALAICFEDFPNEYRSQKIEKMEREGYISANFLRGWKKDIQYFQRIVAIRNIIGMLPFVLREKKLSLHHLDRFNKFRELCGLEPIEESPFPIVGKIGLVSIDPSKMNELKELDKPDTPIVRSLNAPAPYRTK